MQQKLFVFEQCENICISIFWNIWTKQAEGYMKIFAFQFVEKLFKIVQPKLFVFEQAMGRCENNSISIFWNIMHPKLFVFEQAENICIWICWNIV